MSESPTIWECRLGVCATEQQAEELQERIIRLLCPDPDHTPPCPIPRSVSLLPESALDDHKNYADLVDQVRIETGHRP